MGRKLAGGASASSGDSRKKVSHGGQYLWCVILYLHHHHLYLLCRLVHFQNLRSMESIASNRFVHNMVKVHYLHFTSCPVLLCNFRWFNIKTTMAHHPIIQKLDELLAKGGIKPSTCYDGLCLFTYHYVKHHHFLFCLATQTFFQWKVELFGLVRPLGFSSP